MPGLEKSLAFLHFHSQNDSGDLMRKQSKRAQLAALQNELNELEKKEETGGDVVETIGKMRSVLERAWIILTSRPSKSPKAQRSKSGLPPRS